MVQIGDGKGDAEGRAYFTKDNGEIVGRPYVRRRAIAAMNRFRRWHSIDDHPLPALPPTWARWAVIGAAASVSVLALILFLRAAQAQEVGDRPDPRSAPGAVDPRVTPDNIDETICARTRPSWSRSVRPPEEYTRDLKRRDLAAMGRRDMRDFELDHLIPISVGGNPTDPRNLWLEHWDGEWGAHRKDRLELRLFHLVCHHQVGLREAQSDIAGDWVAAWAKYCPTEETCPAYRERGR